MTRIYRPRHDFGFEQIAPNIWMCSKTLTDAPCPEIGVVLFDGRDNFYFAYRLDGTRLDHPSGRAKHFCRMADAGKELWREYENRNER